MADVQAGEQTVTITVDGREISARPGELVIAAAEREGVYIPRFCYHPRMRPVGMCRMCIVEIDTGRGPALQPACMIPVADGMVVDTESPVTKKAQDGVLEFLLINHPLDCPVCDKGGECPLQDQTLAFGPGESRFVEEKRHFEKPIPISDLVHLDRERCILCDRCTRFSKEVAGDPLISFLDRGDHTQVNTFPDHPFASYFSGNTVQICPVGALLASPYRFRARPWDLDQVESTCTSCSFGCRVAMQSSSNRLVRYLGVDVDPVNWGWMCDKGRFDFEAVNSDARLGSPLVREGDRLVDAGWAAALRRAADGLGGARSRHGSGSLAVLGGARLTNEDAYAWSKLARTVLGTDNIDAQLGDGLPADVVLGLPRATIDEACSAATVILLGPDIKEELPVLYLRLRHAAVEGSTRLVELSPTATGLTRHASVSERYRPGDAAAAMRQLLDGEVGELVRGGPVVCVLGRPSVAEQAGGLVDAAAALLEAAPEATFLPALRRSNVLGALDMGLAPGVLPGRVGLDDGRGWFEAQWGALPEVAGLDASGILTAAAEGRIQGLVLLGADPLADFPDRDLARRALAGAGFVVAVDAFLTDSVAEADVVLPAAIYGEKGGSTTNIEGRVSRLNQKVTAPGTARPDWMIASELAHRMGGDLGFDSLESIWDEIERLAPSHSGITLSRLCSAEGFDGVVVGRDQAPSGDRPPAMAQTEAPAVSGAASHMGTDSVAAQGEGATEHPDPQEGSEPAGAASEVADAEVAEGATAEYADGQAPSEEAGDAEAIELSSDARGGDDAFTPGDQGGSPGAGSGGPSPQTPRPLRFSASASSSDARAVDSYSLRLVANRRLYDCGTLVQRSPSLAPLAVGGPLRMNVADLERLGVAAGSTVRVISSRATVKLEVVPDPGVPRGVAAIAFNQPGPGAADLIDAGAPVTEIRVETLAAGGES